MPKTSTTAAEFSGPDDRSLPPRVQSQSKEIRARWAKAYNAGFRNCGKQGGNLSACQAAGRLMADTLLNKKASDLTPDFLSKFRELAKKAGIDSEVLASIMKSARAFAGGKGKAAKKEARRKYASTFQGSEGAPGRSYFAMAEAPKTINIFPIPGIYAHPQFGKIHVTREDSQELIDNFNAGVYQEHIPIDAEHETKLSGAVGWITSLTMNKDGSVEAAIDWNDRGEALLEDDRFKYFSPEWFAEWKDPATEEVFSNVLAGGAITTKPFFKDDALRPLVATEGKLWDVDPEDSEQDKWRVMAFTEGSDANDEGLDDDGKDDTEGADEKGDTPLSVNLDEIPEATLATDEGKAWFQKWAERLGLVKASEENDDDDGDGDGEDGSHNSGQIKQMEFVYTVLSAA